MANALPVTPDCCTACDESVSVAVPGPTGAAGSNGTNGTNGVNAFTTTSAQFLMPAEAANVTVSVADSTWMTPTQMVYVQNCGWMEVQSKPDSTSVILQNVEATATSEYTDNVAPATPVANGSQISPGGLQGPAGADGASGAPDTASYLTQTAEAGLSGEFNLGSLSTGILKVTVAAGTATPSIAVSNTDYLAADAGLVDLAGVAMAADKAYYTTADNTHAAMDVTAFARTILDDASAAAVRSTIGLGTAAVEPVATFCQTANNLSDVTAATARTNLGLDPVVTDWIVLRVEKADGVAGGTATSGSWEDIVLNTESVDTGGNCSLNAGTGEFTLQAGTYRIRAFSPAHEVDQHQCRLRNTTDGSTTLLGSCEESGNTDHSSNPSIIIGRFTIGSAKAFKLQHQVTTTKATEGYGSPCSFGDGEVYATVELEIEA